jgi:hypothetical protein
MQLKVEFQARSKVRQAPGLTTFDLFTVAMVSYPRSLGLLILTLKRSASFTSLSSKRDAQRGTPEEQPAKGTPCLKS